MTVWVLQQKLTPEEEDNFHERTHLILPYGELPDLSMISSALQCRHLMQALNPNDPPESIHQKSERIWNRYAEFRKEDTVAVPLKYRGEVAVMEVMKRYEYHVGEAGSDVHQAVVKWHKNVPLRTLARHKNIFEAQSEEMREVMNQHVRIAIRDHLPHSYNRFAKWKWLLVVFFSLAMVRFLAHLIEMERF